jgi:hypothetical protein
MASPCRTSFASGASHPHLGPDSERQLERKGVTSCASCDGALPMFRNRPVVGVGEGMAGVATEAPFETAWTNQVAGISSLRAPATDDVGATTTSAPAQVRASTLRADPVRGFQSGWSLSCAKRRTTRAGLPHRSVSRPAALEHAHDRSLHEGDFRVCGHGGPCSTAKVPSGEALPGSRTVQGLDTSPPVAAHSTSRAR